MVRAQLRRFAMVLCGLLLVALTLAACGDDPPSTPEPVDQQSAPQAEDAQTSAAETTPGQRSADQRAEQAADAQPEPATGVAELEFEIDSDTVWRDLFDTLSDSERSCLRDELGDERLQDVLDLPLISEGDAEAWMATAYGCLMPERARAVLVSALMAEIAEDEGVEFSEREQFCLREAVSNIDPAAAITAMTADADDPSAAAEFFPPWCAASPTCS